MKLFIRQDFTCKGSHPEVSNFRVVPVYPLISAGQLTVDGCFQFASFVMPTLARGVLSWDFAALRNGNSAQDASELRMESL